MGSFSISTPSEAWDARDLIMMLPCPDSASELEELTASGILSESIAMICKLALSEYAIGGMTEDRAMELSDQVDDICWLG